MSRHIYIYIICIIAASGGLLFGLDQGFINGSLELIEKEFHWTTMQGETFASIMLIGCIFGATASGWLAHTLGRKKTLLLAAVLFAFFTSMGALTHSQFILFFSRFCLGLAVGSASFCVPLYLSEIAPTSLRGGFISMYQLMITIGIFMIYVSNSLIAKHFESWRLMLGVIAVPAIMMFVAVFFIPQTPRWLMLKNRQAEAKAVLEKTRFNEAEVNEEIAAIKQGLSDQNSLSFWHIITQGYFIKVLCLGIFLQLLQQLSGINCVIYYSSMIFESAGFSDPAIGTIVIGLVNVLATIVAVKYVDKWGRKPIMYAGLTVMTITLVLIGIMFHIREHLPSGNHLGMVDEIVMLSATILYIIAFAVSLGPIIWVICAEIFPLKVRDMGMTVTTLTNWAGAYVVVQFSMSAMQHFGGSVLFFFFAFCCIAGYFLVGLFTPETKGIALETIETNLKSGLKLRHLGND